MGFRYTAGYSNWAWIAGKKGGRSKVTVDQVIDPVTGEITDLLATKRGKWKGKKPRCREGVL